MKEIISVTGLGYVGLPVALAFARVAQVIAYDCQSSRVQELKKGLDRNEEHSAEEILQPSIVFTDQPEALSQAHIHIIAVPTPVDEANQPCFIPLEQASEQVGQRLKKGDIVVYESTVYPGATEEICLPILEKKSGLKLGIDFGLAYSPERINPGDKINTISKIKKIVGASDKATLEKISDCYSRIIEAGIYSVSSIKVAEAAKIIENSQRDLNIAFMNELSIIFERLGIDTSEVIQAAATKWNFISFKPGLVGGHCIGVDPYYLTHKAEQLGYHPEVILAGRRINDSMARYVAQKVVKKMVELKIPLNTARVGVLGVTFKENCKDIRNSKIFDLIDELKSFGINPLIHDPIAHPKVVYEQQSVELSEWNSITYCDTVIVAVAHDFYKKLLSEDYKKLLKPRSLLVDIKAVISTSLIEKDIHIWRL